MITIHQMPDAFSHTDCARIVELVSGSNPSDARLVG